MSITIDQAKTLSHGDVLEHIGLKNADGTPMRFRVDGAVKTWKRDPDRIRVPLKRGLYETGYLVSKGSEGGRCFDLDIGEVNIYGQRQILKTYKGKDMDKIQAKVGDTIKGDQWRWVYTLEADDGFKDSGFPGCQFRVHLDDKDIRLAVNVKTTGKPKWNGLWYQSRCKIEFVGDCEASTFTGGTLYHID